LKLTDIDEDNCLSPSDTYKLILAIYRNFSRESSYIDPISTVSLHDVATRRALMRFLGTFSEKVDQNSKKEKGAKKVEKLKDFPSIIAALQAKEKWFRQLLPKDVSIKY